jgi:hypothetical protein
MISAEEMRRKYVEGWVQFAQVPFWKKTGWFAALAGPFPATILDSRDVAIAHLTNDDPRIRSVAIVSIVYQWGPSADFLDYCVRTLQQEQDPTLRMTVLWAIGFVVAGKRDKRIMKIVADILHDQTASETIRAYAYSALLCIGGKRDEQFDLRLWKGVARFPDEANWPLVAEIEGVPDGH